MNESRRLFPGRQTFTDDGPNAALNGHANGFASGALWMGKTKQQPSAGHDAKRPETAGRAKVLMDNFNANLDSHGFGGPDGLKRFHVAVCRAFDDPADFKTWTRWATGGSAQPQAGHLLQAATVFGFAHDPQALTREGGTVVPANGAVHPVTKRFAEQMPLVKKAIHFDRDAVDADVHDICQHDTKHLFAFLVHWYKREIEAS